MLTLLIVLVIVLIAAVHHFNCRERNAILSAIPSPPKLPLIHNSLAVLGKSIKETCGWLVAMNHKLGPVYQLTFDPFDEGKIIVSEPKLAEAILSSNKLMDKGKGYIFFKPWLGNTFFVLTGKESNQRRRILAPAFHFQALENFVEIMQEQAKIFIEKLKNYDGQEVEVTHLVTLYALDVIYGECFTRNHNYSSRVGIRVCTTLFSVSQTFHSIT